MRIIKSLAFTILCLSVNTALAIPAPDNATQNNVNIRDSIEVTMSQIDDIGLVMIWNGNGAATAVQSQWANGNSGYANQFIQKKLTKGDNYIIFALYNKIYQGSGIFSLGGKWAGNFSMKKNGEVFWQTQQYAPDNSRGLKYWKVIKAEVSSSGYVSLSDVIPTNERALLSEGMSALESKLDQDAGISTPF